MKITKISDKFKHELIYYVVVLELYIQTLLLYIYRNFLDYTIMTTLIAYANIQQSFPFGNMPLELIPEKLRLLPKNSNLRVQQRYRCRQLAHFLLWNLAQKAEINTALLGQIYRTASGRPQFPIDNIDFNISHSGDWVAVVLNVVEHEKSAVGIDIEFPKKTRNYTALLRHFASPLEQQWFTQQANPRQAFYRIWCLREAILKSQGVGIVKLSEVQHDPVAKTLHSAYCPQGQLTFISELPFYLAVFAEQSAVQNAQYFCWQENQLHSYQLQNKLNYLVNSSK
ncbi:Sfp protein [Lonepinella sp. MS14437]